MEPEEFEFPVSQSKSTSVKDGYTITSAVGSTPIAPLQLQQHSLASLLMPPSHT